MVSLENLRWHNYHLVWLYVYQTVARLYVNFQANNSHTCRSLNMRNRQKQKCQIDQMEFQVLKCVFYPERRMFDAYICVCVCVRTPSNLGSTKMLLNIKSYTYAHTHVFACSLLSSFFWLFVICWYCCCCCWLADSINSKIKTYLGDLNGILAITAGLIRKLRKKTL